ncbi:MAG: tetratricopeptide repeat protein [Tannerellaceae bacterium]|nr:tetratricopeptide repeat protein [Tannerellaceae bacterium]
MEPLYEYVVGVLNDLDRTEEARVILMKGLKLYPDNLVLKDELCYILEAEGKFTEAIVLCNELIDKDPFSYETWFTLGRLYSMVGDFDKAVEAFDYAMACDESDLELKILKSYCLFMNEHYEEAIEAYKEIVTDDESRERIKPLIAECYIKLNRFEECYDILKDYLASPGVDSDPSMYLNFIRCCVELGYDDEALKTLKKAIKTFPDDIRILSLQALNYIESGQEERALEITEKIFSRIESEVEEEPILLKDFFHNSVHLYFNGNLSRAYKFYKKVFDVHAGLPFAHIQRAMAYYNLGDMELFSQSYKEASANEIAEFMRMTSIERSRGQLIKHIPAAQLTNDYLQNKDNNN